jgi:hypothetical protein
MKVPLREAREAKYWLRLVEAAALEGKSVAKLRILSFEFS